MPFYPFGNFSNPFQRQDFVAPRNIRSGPISSQEIIVTGGSTGHIRSQNYDGTVGSGWALFADGNAYIEVGELGNLTVNGTLTVGDSTAAHLRVVGADGSIEFYDTDASLLATFETVSAQSLTLGVTSGDDFKIAVDGGSDLVTFSPGSALITLAGDQAMSGTLWLDSSTGSGVTRLLESGSGSTRVLHIRAQASATGWAFDFGTNALYPENNVTWAIGASGGNALKEIYVQQIKDENGANVFDVSAGHGGLPGLSDDDHTQYLLADGSRALSGNLDPSSDNAVDLGDATVSFRDLYVYSVKDESGTVAVNTSHGIHLPHSMIQTFALAPADDTPSATSTWELWGISTVGVGVTAGSSVVAIANLTGAIHDAAATALCRIRITFSTDGGSTYSTGSNTAQGHQQSQSSTQRYSVAVTERFSGTMTSGSTFYIRAEIFAPNTTADFVAGSLTGLVIETPT